jgi:vacuolar-type H+-ATPase subunit E/Vma4
MMNIEKAILDEAKEEARAVLAAAAAARAEKMAAERRRIEAEMETLRRQENSRLDAEHASALALERAASAGAVLAEKNRLLDEVFSRALGRLGELPGKQFLAAAREWLSEAPGEIPAVIVAGARERSYIEGAFLDEVNAKRRDGAKFTLSAECETGLPGQPGANATGLPGRSRRIGGPKAAGGGLLVRAGRFVFDHSWNTALSERRGELLPEMAADLFGKEEGPRR